MRDSGLEQAIAAAGGISALARAVGVAQPSVSNWSRIPAERVLAVEAATAVPRRILRPDLYPGAGDAEPDVVDLTRGKLYLLLANLLREAPAAIMLMELGAQPVAETGDIGAALAALAAAARETDADQAMRDHFRLFVGVGRSELVPYASYYRTGFLYERPLVNVREDMKVLGIERAGDSREPEDSIAFLCEAMAGMALGRFPAAEGFEKRFFSRHLAPWAEHFFADLEKVEGSDLYRAAGRLGRLFIGLEREAFAIDPANDSPAVSGRVQEDHHDRKAS